MRRSYSIAYGYEAKHAAALKSGLAKLPRYFMAEICFRCDGEGSHKEILTVGCGGGSYESMVGCEFCDCTGLLQCGKPAPDSVREQVLTTILR